MDHLNIRLDDTFRPKLHGRALYDPRRHRFHSFLKEMGWKLDNDFVPLIDKDRSQITADLNQILQSWLFFGLLATVIQRPAKKVLDLNVFIANGLITTRELSKYLKEWADREISDKAGQTMRMIQVQLALDKARKVVRKCCSVEEGNRQPGNAPTNATIDGKLMLSLMVIGETLSNAKIRIVEQVGTNVRGWHGDANEGWGTPQFLLDRMVDRNWCKRTVHSLKGQLRSNATALLYAYQEHDEKHFKGHQNCTDDECVVKSVDSEGSYDPEHQPACKNKGCPLIGPDMDEIISRIGRGIVPMLEYKSHEHKVEVKVSDHKPHMRYATVSHVWADGYGNPKENRLWKCQLDFFDSLFRKAQSDNDHHHGFRFWIDTLAIPVGNTDTHRQHRKNAIRKINDIFTKATYTIVIDNGLTSMGAGIDYQAAAMRILASRWMRRLWTLQEAYLSRRLLFTFEGPFLKDLDQLEEDYQYALANNELTSNIPSAARAYFHNLLGADRKARINDFPDANGFGLLANVWRAAQWRVYMPDIKI